MSMENSDKASMQVTIASMGPSLTVRSPCSRVHPSTNILRTERKTVKQAYSKKAKEGGM